MKFLLFILFLLLAPMAWAQTPGYAYNFGQTCPGDSFLCKPVPLAPRVFYNFMLKRLPNGVNFTRPSAGWYFDSNGDLQQALTNVPRFDYDPATLTLNGLLLEAQSSNAVRNSTVIGAVAGSPGTFPTYWSSVLNDANLTQEVAGVGTENNMSYIDWRIHGTPATTNKAYLYVETANGITSGQFTNPTDSTFIKLGGGSLTNVVSVATIVRTNDSGGTQIELFSQSTTPTTAALSAQRVVLKTAIFGASVYAQPGVEVAYSSGNPIDITLRVAMPQLEPVFPPFVVTSPIPTTGFPVTRLADRATVSNIPWFNPVMGAFTARAIYRSVLTPYAQYSALFGNNNYGNFLALRFGGAGYRNGMIVDNFVEYPSGLSLPAPPDYTPFTSGMSYQFNNTIFAISGAVDTAGTLQTAVIPTGIIVLDLNATTIATGTSQWIQTFSYWDYPLTSAQLAAETM